MMEKRASFFSRHPWPALFIINVILLFTLLALFELGLRFFAPEWLEFRMQFLNAGQHRKNFGTDKYLKIIKKDDIFYSFEPGSIFSITHYEYANTVKIDSLGGRANGSNITRTTAGIIPFVGDSFVFGLGVEDNEHITALLADDFEANFFNLGVLGTTLPDQRQILHRRLNDLGYPKKVLWAFFLGNDFEELVRYHETAKNLEVSKTQGGMVSTVNNLVSHNPLLKRIYIIQFFGQKMLTFFNKRIGQQWPGIFKIMLATNDSYHARVNSLLDEELSAIVAEAEREQFEPLFIIIPDAHQMNTEIRRRRSDYYGVPFEQLDPQLPNEIIKTALRKRNLPFIDTTSCLSKESDTVKLYYLEGHFTADGQACFARCIREAVAEFLHLPEKVSSP